MAARPIDEVVNLSYGLRAMSTKHVLQRQHPIWRESDVWCAFVCFAMILSELELTRVCLCAPVPLRSLDQLAASFCCTGACRLFIVRSSFYILRCTLYTLATAAGPECCAIVLCTQSLHPWRTTLASTYRPADEPVCAEGNM